MLRLIVPAFLAAAILVSVSARPASADMARDIIKDGTYVNVWPGQTLYCRRGYADYVTVTVLGWSTTQYSIKFSDGAPPFTGAHDSLGLRITSGNPARVDLILETWGSSVMSGTPSCQGNVMFGVINDDAAFSVSFHEGKKVVVQ